MASTRSKLDEIVESFSALEATLCRSNHVLDSLTLSSLAVET
jgi:hypothetical protein